MMAFADELDLDLAWRKTKRDFGHYMNSFVSTPYVIDILDRRQEQWLAGLRERLADENDDGDEAKDFQYEPRAPRIIDVPKSQYHLRPASVLYIEDAVVYSALMLMLYDDIRESISWSAGSRRFSHILYEDKAEDNRWQTFERDHWQDMEDKKIRLAQEHNYVLETDVSGFYENIDIERAISVIRQMTGQTAVAMELWELLDTWAEPRKRGVPQGYGPSDIIAEAYLDSVDRRLKNRDMYHLRFNDDFFVFCGSRDEAILAQNLLEKWLRAKGLNMKAGKTEVLDADTAQANYEEPQSIFRELREQIEESNDDEQSAQPHASSTCGAASTPTAAASYGGGEEGEPDLINEEALEEAYQDHIEDVPFDDLPRHLFRYIINHLGNADNHIAVEYCREYIRQGRPDVRRIIYKYFDDLLEASTIANGLAKDIADNRLRYAYHEFVLMRWFFERDFSSPEIRHAARKTLNRDGILEARDYAIAILGEFGDYSDWENIEMRYTQEIRPTSRAVMAYALRNFERRHRDSFYSRIDDSHHITRMAIEAANEDA